jgi:GNAT superfamily N-acetyltransferase
LSQLKGSLLQWKGSIGLIWVKESIVVGPFFPQLDWDMLTDIVLEVLATHENYRSLGLGSKLLKRGGAMADEAGLVTYLDASKLAVPLYERFGYVEQKYMDEKSISTPMIRPAERKAD